MPIQVTATQAKARVLRLLDDAEAGEEVEITRHVETGRRLVTKDGAIRDCDPAGITLW